VPATSKKPPQSEPPQQAQALGPQPQQLHAQQPQAQQPHALQPHTLQAQQLQAQQQPVQPQPPASLQSQPQAQPPPAPVQPQIQAHAKAQKDVRGSQPPSVSGSVEVTPPSLRAPDAANVPSVVVESSSNEKTMPERPAPRLELPRPEPPPVEPPIVVAASPPEPRKQERPPTGEWFSTETRAVTDATGYDEDFDAVPPMMSGPRFFGGTASKSSS
jgi:hypothetical protein